MDVTPLNLAILVAAALIAGFVNAVAGGGTLISFPALTYVGIPDISANITNTVALSPGYLGGTLAQRSDLETQRHRMLRLLPTAALGGIVGGVLLLKTSEAVFRALIPWLILLACALLAVQNRIKAFVTARRESDDEAEVLGAASPDRPDVGAVPIVAVFGASVYGGYFGAGLGIIVLAVLGTVVHDSFHRINALKQSISFTVNCTAALFFVFSGRVVWGAAAVMAVGSLAGGQLGGRLASRLNPDVLRGVVIAAGVLIAIAFFLKA